MRPPTRDFLFRLARHSVAEFFDDHCPQLAAAMTYHVLFSVVPFVIVLAGVTSITLHATGQQHAAVNSALHALPLSPGGAAKLRGILLNSTGATAGLGLFGVVGLMYSASGMMSALRTALNQAWDLEHSRPFLRGKLIDIGLVVVLLLLAAASLALIIAARFVGRATGVPGWMTWLAGILLPLIISFGTALLIYRVVPAVAVQTRAASAGALVAAILLVAAQNAFSLYLSNFSHYNVVYGSLGAVIASMMFVYITAEIVLLGAEVASEWPRVHAAMALPAEVKTSAPPGLRRSAWHLLRGLWSGPPEKPRDDASRDC